MVRSAISGLIILFSMVIGFTTPIHSAGTKEFVPYLPHTRLFYTSNFGIITTEITTKGNMLLVRNEGDRFRYHQDLMVTTPGLRLMRVYEKFKIMLFVTKEMTSTYATPLLRFPESCNTGKSWNGNTVEYISDDSTTTNLIGKGIGEESVTVPAGTFNALKIVTTFSHAGGEENKVTDWVVPGIGIVKTKINISGDGVMGIIRSVLGYGELVFELQRWEKF